MDTGQEPDFELEELRRIYWSIAPEQTVSISQISNRARQRRVYRRGIAEMSLMVAIAAIAITMFAFMDGDSTLGPVEAQSTLRPTPPSQLSIGPSSGPTSDDTTGLIDHSSEHPPKESTIDAINELIDAQTFGDYYMLRIEPSSDAIQLSVSSDFPEATLADVRDLVAQAGAQLDVGPLGNSDRSHPGLQEKLSPVAERLQSVATKDPSYGYSFLKLEVAWNTIVLWRSKPSSNIDRALQTIADDAGVTLDLRKARFSRQDIAQISDDLESMKATWRRSGFTVTGSSVNPWGALVYVTGSEQNAARLLLEDDRVLAIKNGDFTPL